MKYCPLCETTYGDDIRICSSDGAQLRSGEAKADPLLGQTIRGRYRVIRRLGEGGMGSVYLAEQISVGRKVALKVLHGEFAKDDAFVRRFRQEARLAASHDLR